MSRISQPFEVEIADAQTKPARQDSHLRLGLTTRNLGRFEAELLQDHNHHKEACSYLAFYLPLLPQQGYVVVAGLRELC